MMGEPSSVLMAANRSPGQNCSRIVLRMLVVEQRLGPLCSGERAAPPRHGRPRSLDQSVKASLPIWGEASTCGWCWAGTSVTETNCGAYRRAVPRRRGAGRWGHDSEDGRCRSPQVRCAGVGPGCGAGRGSGAAEPGGPGGPRQGSPGRRPPWIRTPTSGRAGHATRFGLLLGQAQSRVPELVPVRHGRMLVSAFTFYRGRRCRWRQTFRPGDRRLRRDLRRPASRTSCGAYRRAVSRCRGAGRWGHDNEDGRTPRPRRCRASGQGACGPRRRSSRAGGLRSPGARMPGRRPRGLHAEYRPRAARDPGACAGSGAAAGRVAVPGTSRRGREAGTADE